VRWAERLGVHRRAHPGHRSRSGQRHDPDELPGLERDRRHAEVPPQVLLVGDHDAGGSASVTLNPGPSGALGPPSVWQTFWNIAQRCTALHISAGAGATSRPSAGGATAAQS